MSKRYLPSVGSGCWQIHLINIIYPLLRQWQSDRCASTSSQLPYPALHKDNFLLNQIVGFVFSRPTVLSNMVTLVLQCCVCLSSSARNVLWLNGACVLEQKLLLTAYRSRVWEIDRYQNELPWPLFRGRNKVMSTIALHSTLNILETVRGRGLVCEGPPIGDGLWGIMWSRDRWRHVTPKGHTRDPNTLKAQYLENNWRCYLATITNYFWWFSDDEHVESFYCQCRILVTSDVDICTVQFCVFCLFCAN